MDQYFNFLLLIFNSYYLNGYRRPLHRLVIANVTFKGNIFYPPVVGELEIILIPL